MKLDNSADYTILRNMDGQRQKQVPGRKFHVSVAGCTNGAHQTYVNDLKGMGQIEVISPEQSDYLVLFCPIASQVGKDIGEAMDKISGGKPIVLVVMHHTYDKDHFVPESRRLVENPDVIVTVDVLFHESNMLICNRNDTAWSKVKDVLVVSPGPDSSWLSLPGRKFHVSVAGCTNGAHQTYVNDLKGMGQIEVISPEQSDYLVLFCPIASQVGTDIGEAMDKIPGGKPIVLVVMHHTYDKDHFVPESRRLVENPDVIVTVDVLFHESKMLICNRNDMAWFQVKDVLGVSPAQDSSWLSFWMKYRKMIIIIIIVFAVVVVIIVSVEASVPHTQKPSANITSERKWTKSQGGVWRRGLNVGAVCAVVA
ncbi:uncharacterized protein LOC117489245 isoform X1 [Trematomus bernacchii]|uniref:uncharacterized protein LOC117489245 isoform X1 n=1 Tax=Trematomus bernacchii TaxID=40690 RepID=UPI001469D8E7|nr:uncharacterized protein LOC117489245 isoform X1 [Trematomus bernacchii]